VLLVFLIDAVSLVLIYFENCWIQPVETDKQTNKEKPRATDQMTDRQAAKQTNKQAIVKTKTTR